MTHHMLKGYDRAWITGLTNAFLIRSPERVLASYAKKWSDVTLRDIGFVEQAEIFDMVADGWQARRRSSMPTTYLRDPRGVAQRRLCQACGIPFDAAMLAWPAGPKPFDGVWAPHWYNAVWALDRLRRRPSAKPVLTASLAEIAEAARPYYERLLRHRLVSAAPTSPAAGAVTGRCHPPSPPAARACAVRSPRRRTALASSSWSLSSPIERMRLSRRPRRALAVSE